MRSCGRGKSEQWQLTKRAVRLEGCPLTRCMEAKVLIALPFEPGVFRDQRRTEALGVSLEITELKREDDRNCIIANMKVV